MRDKYASPGKFWRPKNRTRQIEERINWCLVNCANGQMLPEDSREMQAMVAYMNWLADGITDPNMKGPENWQNIPGDPFPYEQRVLGPWIDIDVWQEEQRQAWLDSQQP